MPSEWHKKRQATEIKEAQGIAISAMNLRKPEDVARIFTVIMLVYEILGVKESNEEYYLYLANYIKKKHSDISLKELELCFRLVAERKINKDIDLKFLGKLSIQFINISILQFKTYKLKMAYEIESFNEYKKPIDFLDFLTKNSDATKSLITKAYQSVLDNENEVDLMGLSFPYTIVHDSYVLAFENKFPNYIFFTDSEMENISHKFIGSMNCRFDGNNPRHITEEKKICIIEFLKKMKAKGTAMGWLDKFLENLFFVSKNEVIEIKKKQPIDGIRAKIENKGFTIIFV